MRPSERPSTTLPLSVLAAVLAAVAAGAQTPPAEPKAVDPAPKAVEPATQDRARPETASELFRAMAAMRGLEAKFEEEKQLQLLAAPLQSSGALYFLRLDGRDAGEGRAGGGYLTRVVEKPEPSTVRISPRELRVQNRDGTEVIDLERSDKVRTFVSSLVQVFAGDEAALTKAWTVEFVADPKSQKAWTLTLSPRSTPLDKTVKSLTLVGEGRAIVRVEMLEPNGDRTVTRIVGADPNRAFDAAERKKLFGIEPR